ncbi:hypothetical protein NDU88_000897 [Pleurodeles waltl]|uniref:Uncharacterized protein n=1 Tax=Pleurodeles waltl TaxID=8319 RepID=A0AAV7VVD9_PLEWA|nr:hypothetical protein NDU88_000897 [Pleurodeles waltl]
MPEGMSDTLNKILGAIEDSKFTPQMDIGKVSAELGLLRAEHQKLSDKVHQDPEEAWNWLEQYKSGTDRPQKEAIAIAQRRKRRRRSQCRALRPRLTKPTPTHSEEGKLLAI